MMKALPFGWDFRQLRAEQPTTTYPDFKHEIINEIARCMGVPYNIAALNSSDYNYASGRLDHQSYFRSISVEQANIEISVLDRIYEIWSMEYALLRGLDAMSFVRHGWHWDGFEEIDPKKAAEAREIELLNDMTTYADIYGRKGQDWEEKLTQRAAEKKLMNDLGLVPNDTRSNTGDDDDA
jgi:capsid protein